MSWNSHAVWREPAPAGTYATGTLVDHAQTFYGYPTREDAYEAARAFTRTRFAAQDVQITVGTPQPEPLSQERARAWIGHAAVLQMIARERVNHAGGHDHRRGADWCPICANPGKFDRCGIPECLICGAN